MLKSCREGYVAYCFKLWPRVCISFFPLLMGPLPQIKHTSWYIYITSCISVVKYLLVDAVLTLDISLQIAHLSCPPSAMAFPPPSTACKAHCPSSSAGPRAVTTAPERTRTKPAVVILYIDIWRCSRWVVGVDTGFNCYVFISFGTDGPASLRQQTARL